MKEKDIQEYLYNNLEKLPSFIWLEKLKEIYSLNREDLLFYPLKYLLNKKYQNIFNKMENFEEYLYKFPKEIITAEKDSSKPRIDILWYHEDPNTFYILEVKWNKWPERQTITELLQYANWLQINDFPWLSNNDIVFVIVAKEWSNILIQSVVNAIVFKDLNILPIKVSWEKKEYIVFKFFDLWNTEVLKNLNKEIYNEKNYNSVVLAFDEFKKWDSDWLLKCEYEDIKAITMTTAIELSQKWYNWYVLWMEYNWNVKYDLMYKNVIAILYFNPFLCKTKNWDIFSKKKKKIIENFCYENDYLFDTFRLRKNIISYYPDLKLEIEEWNDWIWFSWLTNNGWSFNYWYPMWFLSVLVNDFINYCKIDKRFAYLVIETDDVEWNDQIFYWQYLYSLFEISKKWVNSLKELNILRWKDFL